ncbi:MAG: NAD(P)H-dependent oxidoreductase [Dehalococcoidia bacterium]
MDDLIKILSFAGSLRKGSYNKALLYAASESVPAGTNLEIFDLNGIPLFNQDLESSFPEIVTGFKNKIRAADALLIATPEHNFSIPGVLKNAIDWASRPHGDNSFEGKPVAIMSASTGMLGGSRAQYHLRQSFVFLDMYPINKPEIFVSFASKKFDSEGRLTDSKTSELIAELLVSLVAWAKRLNEYHDA